MSKGLPWTEKKPVAPGVFVIYCAEWTNHTRLVRVAFNEEGNKLFVIGAKECEHSGWSPCSLATFNSLAKRKVWWLRLEMPE